jgi:hypothetical protein
MATTVASPGYAGAQPTQVVALPWTSAAGVAGPLACDVSCVVNGSSASCRNRVKWTAWFHFHLRADACGVAHSLVLRECPPCAGCSLAGLGCGAALGAGPEERAGAPPLRYPAMPNAADTPPRIPGPAPMTAPLAQPSAVQVAAPRPLSYAPTLVSDPSTVAAVQQPSYVPAQAAEAWGRDPCASHCAINSTRASCAYQIQWFTYHWFVREANSCLSAYLEVVQHCEQCSKCSLTGADCRNPALTAPAVGPNTGAAGVDGRFGRLFRARRRVDNVVADQDGSARPRPRATARAQLWSSPALDLVHVSLIGVCATAFVLLRYASRRWAQTWFDQFLFRSRWQHYNRLASVELDSRILE